MVILSSRGKGLKSIQAKGQSIALPALNTGLKSILLITSGSKSLIPNQGSPSLLVLQLLLADRGCYLPQTPPSILVFCFFSCGRSCDKYLNISACLHNLKCQASQRQLSQPSRTQHGGRGGSATMVIYPEDSPSMNVA